MGIGAAEAGAGGKACGGGPGRGPITVMSAVCSTAAGGMSVAAAVVNRGRKGSTGEAEADGSAVTVFSTASFMAGGGAAGVTGGATVACTLLGGSVVGGAGPETGGAAAAAA